MVKVQISKYRLIPVTFASDQGHADMVVENVTPTSDFLLFGVNDYCERTRNAATENILGGVSKFPVTLLSHVSTVITGNRLLKVLEQWYQQQFLICHQKFIFSEQFVISSCYIDLELKVEKNFI